MGKNIDELKGIVGQHIPCWAEADVGEIGFARLSGLTNMTYKVTHPSLRPLIFKWFARAEGLLERSRENLIFAELSEEGIGPKCYYYDDVCRIEEFVEGRHPTNGQLLQDADLRKGVLAKMACTTVSRFPPSLGSRPSSTPSSRRSSS